MDIADQLAEELAACEPGTRVASEPELANRFGVGRAAARSALQELERRLLVRLRTERRGDLVRLWVEDNGIGIKPEHQARIWGMFERVHPQHLYEGTGIGLAIVRKTVERMNGSMGVESDGISGSQFWIQLPGVDLPL